MRILIRITESKDVSGKHLSGKFYLSGKISGWLVKCSINNTVALKYIDFYPYPCILALIIKLTLPMQNFFMIVSNSSPRWYELGLPFCKEKVVKEFFSQRKGVHDQFQVQSPLLFLCLSGRKAQGMESLQPDWYCEPVQGDRSGEHRHT